MEETEFLQKSKELTQFWMQPSVEGVYESKVPLLFRALMTVGATCGLSRKGASVANDTDFALDDLVSRRSQSSYLLPSSVSALHFIYLYHSFTDGRHVICLFYPHLEKATLFMVGSHHDHTPNVQRIYNDFIAQRKARDPEVLGSSDIFTYPDTMEITTRHFNEARTAFKAVSQELGGYQAEKRGPTMAIVQSLKNMRALVPRLGEFPFVVMPANTKDNQFMALDWQRTALRRMLSSFFVINHWLMDQCRLARYANLPLGNLETDFVTQAADYLWARNLHAKDMLLWVSATGKPDLGGKEQDDHSPDLEDWSNPGDQRPRLVQVRLHQSSRSRHSPSAQFFAPRPPLILRASQLHQLY